MVKEEKYVSSFGLGDKFTFSVICLSVPSSVESPVVDHDLA